MVKFICFNCGAEIEFDDTNIPAGEKYETQCPQCGYIAIRKKASENNEEKEE